MFPRHTKRTSLIAGPWRDKNTKTTKHYIVSADDEGKDGELRMGCGDGGRAEGRKGHSMVCVITCFASIGGVCTVRQSTSVSPAGWSRWQRKESSRSLTLFLLREGRMRQQIQRTLRHSSSESKTILYVCALLSWARTASTRRSLLDMEDMRRQTHRSIQRPSFFHILLRLKQFQHSLTLSPTCCPRWCTHPQATSVMRR